MEWTQLRVESTLAHRDEICAVMCMLDEGIVVEDYSDIDMKTVYADLIDEKILSADKNRIAVSIYVAQDQPLTEYVAFLRDRFRQLHIDAQITCLGVQEEEWATAWRKYYKPTPIGRRLMIVPGWEEYTPTPEQVVIRMDPGLAFGTGTHETTRLCGELLEKHVHPGDRLLDVGTGSGILAICGLKLGAQQAFACDIDPIAVRVAQENAACNGVADKIDCEVSDLLAGVKPAAGGYTVCTANIVADIIIRLAPDIGAFLAPHAVLIASGIIDTRQDEVCRALQANGFSVEEILTDGGWCALCCKKAEPAQ